MQFQPTGPNHWQEFTFVMQTLPCACWGDGTYGAGWTLSFHCFMIADVPLHEVVDPPPPSSCPCPTIRKQPAAVPLRVFWKPSGMPQGRYVLHLSTTAERTGAQVEYRVTFDHLW